jgi:transposase InsO family protein
MTTSALATINVLEKPTKTALAKRLGIARSSLYYVHKRPAIDEEIKAQIETVLISNPSYGHRRIALALKLNFKRIRRVMKKFGIKPYRKRSNKPVKKDDVGKKESEIENHIKWFCPLFPHIVWVSDFTYIKYQGRFIYLATIMDRYSREIVGWNISRFHNKELVLGALTDALKRTQKTPTYLHSDQGSEYDAQAYKDYAKEKGIIMSMSAKGSPWENGFQESFYSQFKVDLGEVSRFSLLGELVEAIHRTIYYYNNQRIHTKLKMSPIEFKNKARKLPREKLSDK